MAEQYDFDRFAVVAPEKIENPEFIGSMI